MDSSTSILIHHEILAISQMEEYLCQLVRCIVFEMYGLCETTLQTWVRVDEIVHLIRITSHDTDKLTTIILQSLQQCIDSFCTERVLIIGLQSISFINEQHTTHCRVNKLVGLDGGLSCKSCHQLRAVGLYQLSSCQDAKGFEDISHDTCHSRFTRTWVTRKHIVLALEGVCLATFDLQGEEGCEVGYLFLYSIETHHTIEFLQALRTIDSLRSLVRNILSNEGHQLIVSHL